MKVKTLGVLLGLCLCGGLTAYFSLSMKKFVGVDSRHLSLTRLQAVQKLVTVERTDQVLVEIAIPRNVIGVPVGEDKLLYLGIVTTRAGTDLSEARIDPDGSVRLPPAKILSVDLDTGNSKVVVRNSPWLPVGEEPTKLIQSAQANAIKQALEAACGNSILDQAAKQAEEVVSSHLQVAAIPNEKTPTCEKPED